MKNLTKIHELLSKANTLVGEMKELRDSIFDCQCQINEYQHTDIVLYSSIYNIKKFYEQTLCYKEKEFKKVVFEFNEEFNGENIKE